MLSLMIKLTAVSVEHDYQGNKFCAKVTPIGDVYVNASHIRMFTIVTDQGGSPDTYTRIALGGEDFAYVAETPEQIVALIEDERRKVAA